MAPEQIRREALDTRCDIYGLGCVIFELLAKKTPFSGKSPDDLLKITSCPILPKLKSTKLENALKDIGSKFPS